MYKNKKSNRVDIQVSILMILIVTVSCTLLFLLCYWVTYDSMLQGLESRAVNIHDFLEDRIKKEGFLELTHREDESKRSYKETKSLLENIKSAVGVRYLYTARLTEEGEFVYLVDGLPTDSSDFRHVGDLIETEIIPDMSRALEGEIVLPTKIKETSWGNIFVCYFPMHYEGQIIGVLGIEFDAESQYTVFKILRIAAPLIIIAFCMIASSIAVILFKRISNPNYKDLANTDMLTGLKNRNAFDIDIHNMDLSTDKTGTAMLSMDLDGLKKVNDTLGHTIGDRYIKEGASVIKKFVDKGISYRIGGDEFAAVVKGITEDELSGLVDEIDRNPEEEKGDKEKKVSISAGYAFFDSQKDSSLYDTLKRADLRMYESKRQKNPK